jgi:hypothetical protein
VANDDRDRERRDDDENAPAHRGVAACWASAELILRTHWK